jgi:endonuclease/exonuclease/phosphatase family metal-dependent hydrolase
VSTREELCWLSVNLRSGGTTITPAEKLLRRHGSVDMEWLRRFPEVVRLSRRRKPDLIFLQEAKWFDHYGDELLLYVERLLRRDNLGVYRGFLTRSTRSHHHQVIFIDTTRVEAVHHWTGADRDEPSGLYGFVEVIVDGDDNRTLLLKSIHLNPRDGDHRLAEAKQIHAAVAHAPAGQRALVAGDFNSITSRRSAEQGEPQRHFAVMPAAKRFGKGVWPATLPGGDTAPETRALDYLLDGGWVCQHINDHNTTPTTLPGVDRGGDLIIDRALSYGGIVTVPGTVWVDRSELAYSDHRALGGRIVITDDTMAAEAPIGGGGAW